MRRRPVFAMLGFTLLASVLVTGSGEASEVPKAVLGAPSLDKRAVEETAYSLAEDIWVLSDVDPTEVDPGAAALRRSKGYVSIAFDLGERVVNVYWHGPTNSKLRPVQERARRAGFTVVVNQTNVSAAKVERGIRGILSRKNQLPGKLTSIGPAADGSGIQIAMSSELTSASKEAIRSKAFQLSQVPIVEVAHREAEPALDRQNDTPTSANGGARIESQRANRRCTVGWPIHVGSDERVTTATHCSRWETGQTWYGDTDPLERFWGWNDGGTPNLDAMTIDSPDLYTRPYIWHGSYYTTDRLPIRGPVAPVVNNTACISGSVSGSSCMMTITATNQHHIIYDEFGNPLYTVYPAFYLEVPSNLPGAAGGGDSGAPIYRMTTDGGVVAYGQFSAGTRELQDGEPGEDCRGVQEECGRFLLGPHINSILGRYDARLETTSN